MAKEKKPQTREAAAQEAFRREFAAEDFATDVEAAMERSGMSRADLARKLERSPAFVTQALRRTSNLTLGTMVDIAFAVGLDEIHLRVPVGPGHVKPRNCGSITVGEYGTVPLASGLVFQDASALQYTTIPMFSDDIEWAKILSAPTTVTFEFPHHGDALNDNNAVSPGVAEQIVEAQAGKPILRVLAGGRTGVVKTEAWVAPDDDKAA